MSVLHSASENGLSLETRGRLRLLSTPRSDSNSSTDFDVIGASRSLWVTSCPGAIRCFSQTCSISRAARRALS